MDTNEIAGQGAEPKENGPRMSASDVGGRPGGRKARKEAEEAPGRGSLRPSALPNLLQRAAGAACGTSVQPRKAVG